MVVKQRGSKLLRKRDDITRCGTKLKQKATETNTKRRDEMRGTVLHVHNK